MNRTESNSQSDSRGQRGARVKKASVASLGATVLLVIGYLIATGLGIPLDGLDSQVSNSQVSDSQVSNSQVSDSQVSDSQQPASEQPSRGRPGAAAGDGQARADASRAVAKGSSSPGAKSPANAAAPFRIENVTIRNLDGKVAFRGTVDLTETMRRIDAGRRLNSFRNDGTTFQNRERRLPNKKSGYYTEYVHPTPKLGGPGPQRVITGEQGEAYYTFDHYKTFQRIR